jgi:hypothetical protein
MPTTSSPETGVKQAANYSTQYPHLAAMTVASGEHEPSGESGFALRGRRRWRYRYPPGYASAWHSWHMPDPDVEPAPPSTTGQDAGGPQDRQAWVRANFTAIFGTSAEDLQSQGIDAREYAAQHRDQIRQFAQLQRSQGIAVPAGRGQGVYGPGNGSAASVPPRSGYGYGGGRRGIGRRGGSAWIGVVLVLFALRFLLISSSSGTHAAVFWVLGIGGIMLVARVLLFSWLRNRRHDRR